MKIKDITMWILYNFGAKKTKLGRKILREYTLEGSNTQNLSTGAKVNIITTLSTNGLIETPEELFELLNETLRSKKYYPNTSLYRNLYPDAKVKGNKLEV